LFTRKPVIFDIHSGTHETMIDWEKARPNGFRAAVYFLCDMITMNMADKIILESQDHIRTWSKRYHVPVSKFEQVFLASDDDIMVEKSAPVSNNGSILVHFHGEYAPFHGVEVILRAAHLLKDEPIKFQIIGFGTTYEKDMALAQSLGLDNCKFIRWVPYEELPDTMSRADVCLGFFGDRQRAREVFTNKVVEAIGVKRPLVTMKNAPVSELLTHEKNVLFTEPGSAESLAEAILRLKNDPALRKRLSENGYAEFQAHCTIDAFTARLSEIIQKLVRNS
jgi:glycosyltransferase involved in cell wall biosynthesis